MGAGAERRKLVPRMHQNSPFGDPVGGGHPLPTPYPTRRLDPCAYGARTRRLRRLVLSVPLPLILQFDHWLFYLLFLLVCVTFGEIVY